MSDSSKGSSARPQSWLEDVNPYKPGIGDAGGKAFKLSSNESALGASPAAVAAYKSVAPWLGRYPDGDCLALRAALAARFRLNAANIVCANGSDELITLLIRAYCVPGDHIVVSRYGFVYYAIAARAHGVDVTLADEDDYCASTEALLAAAAPRTRLLFLANPNNPTGSLLPAKEVLRLRRLLPAGVVLVLDGAYAEFVQNKDYSAGEKMVEAGDNVVMLRTFSKIYGLSALRVGWAYAPPACARALGLLRPPFSVNAAAQAAAAAALEDEDFALKSLHHVERWRSRLRRQLAACGIESLPSWGNFLLLRFPSEGRRTAAAADAFLTSRGVLLRRLDDYQLPHCLRITIGAEDALRAAVAALSDFMRS